MSELSTEKMKLFTKSTVENGQVVTNIISTVKSEATTTIINDATKGEILKSSAEKFEELKNIIIDNLPKLISEYAIGSIFVAIITWILIKFFINVYFSEKLFVLHDPDKALERKRKYRYFKIQLLFMYLAQWLYIIYFAISYDILIDAIQKFEYFHFKVVFLNILFTFLFCCLMVYTAKYFSKGFIHIIFFGLITSVTVFVVKHQNIEFLKSWYVFLVFIILTGVYLFALSQREDVSDFFKNMSSSIVKNLTSIMFFKFCLTLAMLLKIFFALIVFASEKSGVITKSVIISILWWSIYLFNSISGTFFSSIIYANECDRMNTFSEAISTVFRNLLMLCYSFYSISLSMYLQAFFFIIYVIITGPNNNTSYLLIVPILLLLTFFSSLTSIIEYINRILFTHLSICAGEYNWKTFKKANGYYVSPILNFFMLPHINRLVIGVFASIFILVLSLFNYLFVFQDGDSFFGFLDFYFINYFLSNNVPFVIFIFCVMFFCCFLDSITYGIYAKKFYDSDKKNKLVVTHPLERVSDKLV